MEAYRQCSVCGAAYGKQPVLHPLRQSCGHTVRGTAPVDLLCYSLLTTSASSAATGFGGGSTVLGEPLLEHVDDATRVFLRPVDSRGILRFLTWLPEGHRPAVMAKGTLEGCRNPSAVLNHRMERAFGGALVPPLAHYAHDNQLGRDCVQFLQSLRPEVLREVVRRGGVLSCASPLSVLQQRAGVVVDHARAAADNDAASFLRGGAAPAPAPAPAPLVAAPPPPPAVLADVAAPPLLPPQRALPQPTAPPATGQGLLDVKEEEAVAPELTAGEAEEKRLRVAAPACDDLFSQDLLGRDVQGRKPLSVVHQPPPPPPPQQQQTPPLTPPLACFAGAGAAASATLAAEPRVAAVKQEEGVSVKREADEAGALPAAKRLRESLGGSSLASAEVPLFLSPPTLLKPRTRPAGVRDTLPLQRF